MSPYTASFFFAVLLAGTLAQAQDYSPQMSEIIRLLIEKPWLINGLPLDQDTGFRVNEIDVDDSNDIDESGSEKRSAVATALNGRRRRQPTPALGKAVTPYVGVGVLSGMENFLDSIRDNLESLASLSPEQKSTYFQNSPTVVHAPAIGGGGNGMRRLNALRPLRPTGSIKVLDCYDTGTFKKSVYTYLKGWQHIRI